MRPIIVRKNVILFEIVEPLKSLDAIPKLKEHEVEKIFGSYKLNPLGKGGFGEVFEVTHKGQQYALKKNALEAFDLERFQFTNAVVKIYALFQVGKAWAAYSLKLNSWCRH